MSAEGLSSLVAGDRAWCFLEEPIGKLGKRRLLAGAALVQVIGPDGAGYLVRILRASGGVPGREIVMTRAALFARAIPEEHARFGAELKRIWEAP